MLPGFTPQASPNPIRLERAQLSGRIHPMKKHPYFAIFCLIILVTLAGWVPTAYAQETTPAPFLLITVTPQADGSVTHTVLENETLITIAQAYSIPLVELLELNGLTSESVIFPGEKLTVSKAYTQTPTAAITDTYTPRPATPTRRPTRTPTPKPPTPTATGFAVTPTATPVPANPMDTYGKVMVGAIVVFGVIGVLLMVAGEVLKRKK